MQRSISRVSALLETVDLEFERLLQESNDFELQIKNKILSENNLELILNEKLPKHNKVGSEDYSNLVDSLIKIGIKTKPQLELLIDGYLEKALLFEKEIINKIIDDNKKSEFIVHFGAQYSTEKFTSVKKTNSFFNQSALLAKIIKLEKQDSLGD